MKILLVEDDDASIAVLTKGLTTHHYVVDVVRDGEAGWNYGSTFEYDLIVLDIMLPKLDGIRLCQRFRTEGVDTPILLLTAQDTSTTKVQGLDAGADDYVVKPFDMAELIARIRALLRRGTANPFPVLTWGNLVLNPSTCEVTYNNQPLTLTTKEYELLELLLRESQSLFSAEEILDRLWSSEEFPSEATVRSHIRRLRQKLVSAGAPSDLITTMHGRGYYLKAAAPESTSPNLTEAAIPNCDRPNQQAEYQTFLNQTWTTNKPKILEQLTLLMRAIADLKTGSLQQTDQKAAHQAAHRLAGTLGIFGLTEASQMARHLEHWLNDSSPLQTQHAASLEYLILALQKTVDQTELIRAPNRQAEFSPLLWIIDMAIETDDQFAQSLEKMAIQRGMRMVIAPHVSTTRMWLSAQPSGDHVHPIPDAIVLRWLPNLPDLAKTLLPSSLNALDLLQAIAHHYPNSPILVLGDCNDLSDRLEIIRRGGRVVAHQSITPEQTLNLLEQLLGFNQKAKVMVVDDDQIWLETLPVMLKPWGFKVTTLADPQQFWTVLQTVEPDVLILDINMPQMNGLELCQILRSDPHWQRLPVLFLSILTDPKTQNHAFNVGADDYLCKPILGLDLANRIRNRLHRMHTFCTTYAPI